MDITEHLDLMPEERQQLILERIRKYKGASVQDLAKEFFINEATIRRDLNKLERTGLIKRTYGGALLIEGLSSEIPLFARESYNTDKKDTVALLAAELVKDGDTIILDSSSTASKMINYLSHKKNLTVITNGAKTSLLLSKIPDFKIYCTGGSLRENSLSFIGAHALDFIKNIYVDCAFFSCRGVNAEKGFFDSNEDEANLRKAMIKSSKFSYLLADSSKINTTSTFHIGAITIVDKIICDIKLPAEYLQKS